MLKYSNNNDKMQANIENNQQQQQQELYENINYDRRESTSTFDNNPAEIYTVINTVNYNNQQPKPATLSNPPTVPINNSKNVSKLENLQIETQYFKSILGIINILLIVRIFRYI
jgi:hypothetical protein